MQSKASNPAPASCTDEGLQWVNEWITKDQVVLLPTLQVRTKLNARAVHRYASHTRAGKTPPPIKVARVETRQGTRLYLIDGWHRWKAGALQETPPTESFSPSEGEGPLVLAQVACMTFRMAQWEAAKANTEHGVPLTGNKEYRKVFRAYVASDQHRTPTGGFRSYREIASVIGKHHCTIRNWTQADFPAVARAMGGTEGANHEPGLAPLQPVPLAEEHRRAADEAVDTVGRVAPGMTPEDRYRLLAKLDGLTEEVRALGTAQPPQEEF